MLNDDQRRRITRLIEREDPDDTESLRTLQSAEELHQFVLNYNWDDGYESILEIITHPLCDRGTGLLAYWLSGPFTCTVSSRDECDECDHATHDAFMELESRLSVGGFSSETIRIDPHNLLEPGDNWVRVGLERKPPELLTRPTPGKTIEADSLEFLMTGEELAQHERLDDDEVLESLRLQASANPAFEDNLAAFQRYYEAKHGRRV